MRTFPHRILRQLEMLDSDRGKAIVKCVWALTATALTEGEGIEITPARFLLSLPSSTDVSSLEVAIMDVIEHLPMGECSERKLL
jgi:hypothetical protein